MAQHDVEHETERWWILNGPSGECIGEITEHPRTSEASAPNHHTITSRVIDHAQCIARIPDVAVAENLHLRNVTLERRDGVHRALPE